VLLVHHDGTTAPPDDNGTVFLLSDFNELLTFIASRSFRRPAQRTRLQTVFRRPSRAAGLQRSGTAQIARQHCEDDAGGSCPRRARTRDGDRHRPGVVGQDLVRHAANANADGKVVSFKNAGKFGQRYSTLECQDSANLDDGDLWPVSYALKKWIPAVDKNVIELVEAAIS
jgi:hypothetical protein